MLFSTFVYMRPMAGMLTNIGARCPNNTSTISVYSRIILWYGLFVNTFGKYLGSLLVLLVKLC